MKLSEIVFESKDLKGFTVDFKEIIKDDNKFYSLLSAYKKDQDKMVDLIDYTISKYKNNLESLMKKYYLTYDDVIEVILGVK